MFCNYCRRNGHTIDRCFKLQRQRGNARHVDRGKRLAATAQYEDTTSSDQEQQSVLFFTQDQYAKLIAMMNKHNLETSVTPSGESTSAAILAGKVLCFSASNPDLKWIVDSGATNYITPNLHYFSSYSTVHQDSFITMPNGRQSKIHHICTIQLTSSLTWFNALHVPDFHYNLLFASKLDKQLIVHVVFTPDHYYIQDPSMKQPLEIGKEVGGLYPVDHKFCNSSLTSSSAPSSQPSSTSAFSFSSQMYSLELWHCKLGMSFDNMKHIDIVSSCKSKPSSICQVFIRLNSTGFLFQTIPHVLLISLK